VAAVGVYSPVSGARLIRLLAPAVLAVLRAMLVVLVSAAVLQAALAAEAGVLMVVLIPADLLAAVVAAQFGLILDIAPAPTRTL
jgi:hypothetical protein